MSHRQDWYPFPCHIFWTITTSGMDQGYVLKWQAFLSLVSLQRTIWTPSVELISQQWTGIPSINSSSWPWLGSPHPCDRTCHCTLWYCDAMWLYGSLTATESNIGMAWIPPWHTWQSSIHPELWTVTGFDSILDLKAAQVWNPGIGWRTQTTPVYSSNLSSHPYSEVHLCGLWQFDIWWTRFGDQVSA